MLSLDRMKILKIARPEMLIRPAERHRELVAVHANRLDLTDDAAKVLKKNDVANFGLSDFASNELARRISWYHLSLL